MQCDIDLDNHSTDALLSALLSHTLPSQMSSTLSSTARVLVEMQGPLWLVIRTLSEARFDNQTTAAAKLLVLAVVLMIR